jgi:hypothetical protein
MTTPVDYAYGYCHYTLNAAEWVQLQRDFTFALALSITKVRVGAPI